MECVLFFFFFFQAEDGIRDLVRSRGLGDVYKRQAYTGVQAYLADHPGSPTVPAANVSAVDEPMALPGLSLIHI